MSEPEKEGDLFETIKGTGKRAFDRARTEVNTSVDDALKTIGHAKSIVVDGYQIIEQTVGRDRMIGAAAGAKVGALLMAKPGPFILHGIAVGGLVGGAIGFVVGPKFFDRYRKVNDNDQESKPPAAKPDDPAP